MALTPANINSARNLLNTKNADLNKATNSITNGATTLTNTVKTFNNTVNSVNLSSDMVTNLANTASTAISDPFSAAIKNVLGKINTIIPAIEKKIDKLETDIVKKSDAKGRVTLQGNNIVVTVTRAEYAQAQTIVNNIKAQIDSIRQTIVTLQSIIAALKAISTAINVFLAVLAVQELVLTANPISKATYEVFKKAIKIVFLKEIISAYTDLIQSQVTQAQAVMNNLINKFTHLHVSVTISDEADKGNFIGADQAQSIIASDLLNMGGNEYIKNVTSDYTSNNGGQYILKVEKYGTKENIARAYDKFSGLVAAETAPSFLSTPDQLMEELKTILNIGS